MSEPTRSHTVAVTIKRAPADVYEYITDPAHLPAWASGLATTVERRGEQWVLQAGDDELLFAFVDPNVHLVADHRVTLPDGTSQLNPMRVLPNGDGSEVLFTLFRGEAASDGEFEELIATVTADLESLRAVLTSLPAGR